MDTAFFLAPVFISVSLWLPGPCSFIHFFQLDLILFLHLHLWICSIFTLTNLYLVWSAFLFDTHHMIATCHPHVTWLHWFLFLIIWFLPVSVALCLMLWKAYTYKSGLFPLFYLLEIPLFIVLNSNDHFFLTSQTFGNNFFL